LSDQAVEVRARYQPSSRSPRNTRADARRISVAPMSATAAGRKRRAPSRQTSSKPTTRPSRSASTATVRPSSIPFVVTGSRSSSLFGPALIGKRLLPAVRRRNLGPLDERHEARRHPADKPRLVSRPLEHGEPLAAPSPEREHDPAPVLELVPQPTRHLARRRSDRDAAERGELREAERAVAEMHAHAVVACAL